MTLQQRPGPVIVPSTPRECALVLSTLKWVVNHTGALLGPDLELVLHDLSHPDSSVVAIANGRISGRGVGSAIFSGPFDDKGLKALIENGDANEACTVVADYRTRLPDGRELDSLSLMFRNQDGRAFAALCANADRSRLLQLRGLIEGLFAPIDEPAPKPDESPSVDVMVHSIIEESIASVAATTGALTKDERAQAVRLMNDRGLFLVRSSVEMAAERLGVTRHTIYNYLDKG
ncbi:helix-turn-helix transcriptional regulator [Pararhodobacter zhoushanensis]|uniref:helix-turn-helix transcriptional regulator n=1 Tax=Pararhodobacter zhoushanensis TaxID=2479545 RepID=UPI000F8E3D44|nr:PAS domain-containing protein [Pararhodobacter zhoushanensis]